ncbi:MAG: hypothetical protein NVSMB65_07130 [Chloroflexota bacterium]
MSGDGDGAPEKRDDSGFYRLPATGWSGVDAPTTTLLAALARDLQATLGARGGVIGGEDAVRTGEASGSVLEPTDLALRLGEAAGQLFGAVAGDEGDLRQIISTMRTALALCWDMYSADETGRVTVRQHMERLRDSIVEFEADLTELQRTET